MVTTSSETSPMTPFNKVGEQSHFSQFPNVLRSINQYRRHRRMNRVSLIVRELVVKKNHRADTPSFVLSNGVRKTGTLCSSATSVIPYPLDSCWWWRCMGSRIWTAYVNASTRFSNGMLFKYRISVLPKNLNAIVTVNNPTYPANASPAGGCFVFDLLSNPTLTNVF